MENQKLLANEVCDEQHSLCIHVCTCEYNILIMGDLLCFQAQTAVKKCPQLSVYQKDGIKQKGFMRFTEKAEGDLDIK